MRAQLAQDKKTVNAVPKESKTVHRAAAKNKNKGLGYRSMGQFTFEEINLICCYRKKTRADTVAAMTAALPYMETKVQELAERTAVKLKKLTEKEFAGLVFLPAEDME